MAMRPLAVVIPVHNLWPVTRACLQSLRENTPGDFFQVVLADNGSTDATPAEAPDLGRALFGERFTHLPLGENLGFGPACNAGARATEAEHVLFLNNDTTLTPGWVRPLLTTARKDARAGAVSPLLLYPETEPEGGPSQRPEAGRVQHAGIGFDPDLHPVHPFHLFPADHPAVTRPRRLQAVSGAAMLVGLGVFRELGGFFEGFRNGSEDLDLCARLRGRGLRCLLEPKAVVHHHTSLTPGRYEHTEHNARLLNQRCRGAFATDLHKLAEREGFTLALTPWQEPYMAMRGEDAERLAAVGDPRRAVQENPLWRPGYAAWLEAAADPAERHRAAALQAGLLPALEALERAAATAVEAGFGGEAQRWRDLLARARAKLAAPEILAGRARANRDHFAARGEEGLAALYGEWLEAGANG